MPRFVAVLLLLISLSVGASEPQGFVLKAMWINESGSTGTMFFPGVENKVFVFKRKELCEETKAKSDEYIKKAAPDLVFEQKCLPYSRALINGLEKRPKTS